MRRIRRLRSIGRLLGARHVGRVTDFFDEEEAFPDLVKLARNRTKTQTTVILPIKPNCEFGSDRFAVLYRGGLPMSDKDIAIGRAINVTGMIGVSAGIVLYTAGMVFILFRYGF